MNNRQKLVILATIASFPVMLFFQNCGAPVKVTEVQDSKSQTAKSHSINSDSLPLNTEVEFNDQNQQVVSPSPDSQESSDSFYQVVDRQAERVENIVKAVEDCEKLQINESQNQSGSISANPVVVKGLRGAKVLSSNDFEGNSHISLITNAYGKVVLCGLEVDVVENSGGGLILINSKVKKINGFQGHIDLVAGSAVIDSSNVKIFKATIDLQAQPVASSQ